LILEANDRRLSRVPVSVTGQVAPSPDVRWQTHSLVRRRYHIWSSCVQVSGRSVASRWLRAYQKKSPSSVSFCIATIAC
jgi:hypothetical protein